MRDRHPCENPVCSGNERIPGSGIFTRTEPALIITYYEVDYGFKSDLIVNPAEKKK